MDEKFKGLERFEQVDELELQNVVGGKTNWGYNIGFALGFVERTIVSI